MRYEFHDHPADFDAEPLFNEATLEVANYTVMLATEGRSCGSGTLVSHGATFGVLTAAHVIDHLMHEEKCPMIELVFRTTEHRLSVEKKYLGIRRYRGEGGPADGPDVALIAIADQRALGTIKAAKSFLPFGPDMSPIFDAMPKPETALCCFAGAPAELDTETGTRGTASHVLTQKLFLGRTQIVESRSQGPFHYLGCASLAGEHGFPKSFGGVSGGGIWHIPLEMVRSSEKSSLRYLPPELIGVAFYQTDLKDSGRIIRAHRTQGLSASLA